MHSGEFIEEQIFNWTYSDEQSAKENWKGENNPYLSLPRMVMMTYKIPESIRSVASEGEFDGFDLNLFFSAKGKSEDARFVNENEVQKWLDLIRGAYLPASVDDLKIAVSLTYTGIDMHSNDKEIGGWDTAIRKDEYKKLFYNQQESMNAPKPTEATEDIVELKKEVTRSSAVKSVQPSGKSTAASPTTPPLVTEKFGIKSPVPKATLPVPDRKHTNTPDFDESSITVGMTVIHKKFGEGKVQSIADKHIYVKFADGQKNFAFPNAFTAGFLHLPK